MWDRGRFCDMGKTCSRKKLEWQGYDSERACVDYRRAL